MKNIYSVMILICLIVSSAIAQTKTKSVKVYHTINNHLQVSGVVRYGDDGLPTDTTYYIGALNDQYTMITDNMIICNGPSLQEIYDFVKQVKHYVDREEINVTIEVGECRITVCKMLGLRSALIHPINEPSKFCCYDYGQLYGILKGVKKYCKKNHISLKA